MPPLTRDDREMLRKLGIDEEILDRAGVVRVDEADARAYGVMFKGDLNGILFPYFDPATGARTTCRLRRDHPEQDEHGKPLNKYLSPKDDNRHLYFPPDCASLLADPSVPVVIVEAEKSVLDVASVATRSGRPLLPIGIGGCASWQGKVGRGPNPNGERVTEKGPLPDFWRVEWNDRTGIMVFDANVATNQDVKYQRTKLAKDLIARGAKVLYVDIPESPGVNGPDDYIGTYGDAAFLRLLDDAKHFELEAHTASVANLLELVRRDGELFHDRTGNGYATVAASGHRETYAIATEGFRKWVLRRHFLQFRKPAPTKVLDDTLDTLDAIAQFEGPEKPVFTRLGNHEGEVYLDLGTSDWSAVRITTQGWSVVPDPPAKFRRPAGMQPLPVPLPGGDIQRLRAFLNAPDEPSFWLMVAWELGALRPTGPYPVLDLNGEHGTAKSTVTKFLRRLIDPNAADIRAVPGNTRDLAIAAENAHILAFDNLSGLTPEMSDALCRLATGGGFATRRLYTDDGEKIFQATRPVILNGIEQPASRPDLLDRAIVITLRVISGSARKSDAELERQFEAERPYLLGALLDAAVSGLRNEDTVSLPELPRLADFARWAAAALTALALSPSTFVTYFNANKREAEATALENDVVGAELLPLLAEQQHEWHGTSTALLEQLNARRRVGPNPHGWPTTPEGMRAALTRLAPMLRSQGYDVHPDRTKDARRIRITRTHCARSAASATADDGDDGPLDQPSPEWPNVYGVGDGGDGCDGCFF